MDVSWIITTFILVDTAMTNLHHQTDMSAGVPVSEIVTVALVTTKFLPIIIGLSLM